MQRTLVVGDIHGCLEEFDELLLVAGFVSGDRLLLLGDLLDRGPDSIGTVRRARELGAECLMGNHEEKHLRWRRYELRRAQTGAPNPMRPFPADKLATQAGLTPDDWAYLERLPLTACVTPTWLAIHAGLEPHKPLSEQKPQVLMRARWVDAETGKMRAIDPEAPEVQQPKRSVFWTEVWPGPENVIYGHHVASLEIPRFDVSVQGVTCLGLDTGACFGGYLTGCWFVGGQRAVLVQVKARATYASYGRFAAPRV